MRIIKSSKIDSNADLKSCVVLEENQLDRSLLPTSPCQYSDVDHWNKQLTDEGYKETAHLKNIIIHNIVKLMPKRLDVREFKVIFDRFPGFLHIVIDSLEKLTLSMDNMISLEIRSGSTDVCTEMYTSNDFIKLSKYLKIPILNGQKNTITVKVSIMEHENTKKTEIFVGIIDFSSASLENMHNKLVENRLEFTENTSALSKVFGYITNSRKVNPSCKYYCSFISASEFDEVQNAPNSLVSLSKWIVFRRYAFEVFYQGVMSVKNADSKYRWNQRFVQWIGYMFFIFDTKDNKLIQIVDVSESEPSLEGVHKGVISFKIEGKSFEIECENEESLKKCIQAAYRLFPAIMEWV